MIAGAADGSLLVWDLVAVKLLKTIQAHTGQSPPAAIGSEVLSLPKTRALISRNHFGGGFKIFTFFQI